jgi:hypothetical protein
MSTIQGLNPPTPYTGTDTTQVKLNSLESAVDMLLPQIMSGGALVGSGPAFAPGDSIGSFHAGSTVGQAVVQFIQMLLMQIAALEAQAGNSQALWSPFSSSTASSVGDTMRMPPGWSGSGGGAGPGPAPGAGGGGPPPNVLGNRPPPGGGGPGSSPGAGGGGPPPNVLGNKPPPNPGGSSTGPGSSGSPAGVSSGSVGYAGNGTDETYHVVNKTNHAEYLTYTDTNGGSCTISLGAGQSGTIYAAASAVGGRITPDGTTPNPSTKEKLFENGATLIPGTNLVQYPLTQNPDISAVDSQTDGSGNPINIVVTLPNGLTAGDGQPIRAYQYSTDDSAAMGLAGSSASEMTVTFS